jgi:hypothetical protein
MPQRWPRALAYAALIWVVGFAWGSVVFMTPALKAVAPIRYVSSNPAISFPILLVWLPLAYLLARSYLRAAADPAAEGLRLGLVFAEVNLLLDVLVLVVALDAGWGYFASLTVWLAYALLLAVPWWAGRAAQSEIAATAGR